MQTLFLKQGDNLEKLLNEHNIQADLPDDIGIGYYKLDDEYMLIVYPSSAYCRTEKSFGFHTQLFSLRSDSDWGVGDFKVLKSLIDYVAKVGGAFIQLTPILAIDHSWFHSPYEPISRFAVDTLYIDIEKVANDYNINLSDIVDENDIKNVRECVFVNYDEVLRLKYNTLYEIFKLNKESIDTSTGNDVLAECMSKLHSEFLPTLDLCFVKWLHFIADEQWDSVKLYAKEKLTIGLISDLPMGLSTDNCDTLAPLMVNQKPVIIESKQEWDISTIDYSRFKTDGYDYFIKSIRYSMKNAGGLRIDNDNSWREITLSNDKEINTYSFNNYEKLLAILMLESQLNKCEVILECPFNHTHEQLERLYNMGFNFQDIYLSTVNSDNLICKPNEFNNQSMLVFSTHDIYPLKAHLTSNNNFMDLSDKVDDNWVALIQLQNYYLDRELSEIFNMRDLTIDNKVLFSHLLGAKSKANMFSIYLTDLLLMTDQVNIPNTSFGFSNWTLRLNKKLIEIFNNQTTIGLLSSIKKLRKL